MMELIQNLVSFVNKVSSGNPMIAGALSLWGMATLTYISRSIPSSVWESIKKHSTTRLTLELNSSSGGERLYNSFSQWVLPRVVKSYSRSLLPSYSLWDGSDSTIVSGYGVHFFFFERRPFWFLIAKVESQGTHLQKREISIVTIGRSSEIFSRMLSQFRPAADEDIGTNVFQWASDDWAFVCKLAKRPLSSVALPEQTRTLITESLDSFYADREWYIERGISHKLCVMLHGKPGCGKTSLVRAISNHYNKDVYAINLTQMTDLSFQTALAKVGKKGIILIEDFDSAGSAVGTRSGLSMLPSSGVPSNDNGLPAEIHSAVYGKSPPLMLDKANDAQNPLSVMMGALTMTGVLNALDGIVGLDNNVIFFTTNCLSVIDPALLRKGRCDLTIELDYLQDIDIKNYLKYVYPDLVFPYGIVYAPIAGCDLQALVLDNKKDGGRVLCCLPVTVD